MNVQEPPIAAHSADGALPAADPAPAIGEAVAAASDQVRPGAPGVAVAPAVPVKRRRLQRRFAMVPIGIVVLAVAAYVGINFYRDGLLYVSTDNAQLTGTPVQVGSLEAGRVASITPKVGATVHRGDVLALVDMPSQVGATPTGAPKMDFLGTTETRVAVTAPIDGVVIAEPAAVGTTVTAGQPIITLVDPTRLWVNANIEETKVARLKVGQEVDVHVDALGETVVGRVEAITPATAASFSLIPQSNAALQLPNALAGAGVPQPGRPICAGGGEVHAVGAEGHRSHRVGVSPELEGGASRLK